jgi:uncharacterized membrane protein YkoI
MRKAVALVLSGALTCTVSLVPLAGSLAHAQDHDDQGQVRREMRAGNVRPLRDIESIVLPQMRGMQYLGPEYDAGAMAYRLKFIRDGRVVFVDIDARSGRVIKRSN